MLHLIKQLLSTKDKSPLAPTKQSISWVIPSQLAVGSLPRQGADVHLAEANIQVVLSLCDPSEGTLPEAVSRYFDCVSCVLPDSYYKTEITGGQINQAVEIIRYNLENNRPIYVHCLAGIERSPTVCIAYLCRYYNVEIWEATNWLKEVHPRSQPSASGMRAIRDFISINTAGSSALPEITRE